MLWNTSETQSLFLLFGRIMTDKPIEGVADVVDSMFFLFMAPMLTVVTMAGFIVTSMPGYKSKS